MKIIILGFVGALVMTAPALASPTSEFVAYHQFGHHHGYRHHGYGHRGYHHGYYHHRFHHHHGLLHRLFR